MRLVCARTSSASAKSKICRPAFWPPGSNLASVSGGVYLPLGFCCGTFETEGPGFHLDSHHQSEGAHGPWIPDCSTSGAQLVENLWGKSGMVRQTTYYCPSISQDQLTTRLTDRIHQCSFQAATAMNNVTRLALSICSKTKELNLSPAELDELYAAADTITNLCTA